MTLNRKDEETIQNEEQKETEEPLLGKTQSIIIDRSQGTPGRMVSPAGASEDVIVSLIGQKGWWQLRTTLAIFLTKIPAAWFMACIIFTAPQPWYGEYECDITTQETSNGSIYPVKITADGEYQNDFCYVFKNASQTIKTTSPLLRHNIEPIIEPCETFHYNLDPKTTLITQFDLVCSRSILVAITQCFHLFGVLLGGIFATEAMEFYSPRKVMMCGMVLQIACGIITGYVPYFWLHVAFRCLSAVCCALTFTPGMAIMADIWGGKYKTIVSANFEQFWSIGVILLPAIGYYTNTWAQIYVTISLPTVLIMILWWWIPDPPRWHLERSDIKTAQKIIENAILVNNKNGKMSVPDNLQEMLKIEAHVLIRKRSIVKKSKWIELLSIKGASWRLFFVATSWSLMFTCYYGALLNIRSFGREYLYVNTALAGLSELIGGAFGFVILMQTKRKWLWIGIFTAITGIINCTIWFFPSHVNGSHMLYDLMGIAMLNKVGISASLCVLTTCTAELFPLPHKKRAVYTSTVCARIIFMTAPLIGFTAIFGDGVSMSFFGVLTIISGFLTLLLNPLSESKDTTANKSNVWTVKMETEQTKL